MREFFLPTQHNNYTPHLLSKFSLSIFLVVLLGFNMLFGQLALIRVSAAVDSATIYQLHNQEREKRGLGNLTVNSKLAQSASAKAQAMLASNCWSHYCPNGKSPWDFFDDASYTYVYAGENLAEGYFNNEDVMTAWMNSPTHRENVLNPNFEEIGVGFANGTYQGVANNEIIVVHFGSRKGTANGNSNTSEVQGGANTGISITSPSNNTYFNSEDFDISGKTVENSTVDVSANNKSIGRVDAVGESFTMRPQTILAEDEYRLTASAYNSNNQLIGNSDPVYIHIDKTAPQISASDVKVSSVAFGETETISISFPSDEAILASANMGGKFEVNTRKEFEGEVTRSELEKVSNFTVKVTDRAGNITTLEVPTQTLLKQADVIAANLQINLNPATYWSGLVAQLNKGDLRTQINLAFIVFLLVLFVLDFVVLARSGMTGLYRSKSHLHMAQLSILIIVVLLASFSGNLLEGIKQ